MSPWLPSSLPATVLMACPKLLGRKYVISLQGTDIKSQNLKDTQIPLDHLIHAIIYLLSLHSAHNPCTNPSEHGKSPAHSTSNTNTHMAPPESHRIG